VSRTSSAFTGKPFGVARVCRIWDMARSTTYWRRQPSRQEPRRRGPRGFHTDAELTGEIKGVLTESLFTGESYRKVWAMLRDKRPLNRGASCLKLAAFLPKVIHVFLRKTGPLAERLSSQVIQKKRGIVTMAYPFEFPGRGGAL